MVLLEETLNKVLNDRENLYIYRRENINKFKGIVLYGAGNLGEMAIKVLEKCHLPLKYFIDKNEGKWGTLFSGIRILSPESIKKEEKNKFLFVDCITKCPFDEIKQFLLSKGCKHVIHFYDMTYLMGAFAEMTNGWRYEMLEDKDVNSIRKVYSIWADDISRKYYLMVLYWRIKHKEIFFDDIKIEMDNKFFPQFIQEVLTDAEVFVDCGAYTGNTINKFLTITNNKFAKIIAYEPDQENMKCLEKYWNQLSANIKNGIVLRYCGVGEKTGKRVFLSREISSKFLDGAVDDGMKKQNLVALDDELLPTISFLKMHIEGMELPALKGAINKILTDRPILAITLYHTEDGCYRIPLYLMNQLESYRFYHRVHMYCAQSSVLYCIPFERFG